MPKYDSFDLDLQNIKVDINDDRLDIETQVAPTHKPIHSCVYGLCLAKPE